MLQDAIEFSGNTEVAKTLSDRIAEAPEFIRNTTVWIIENFDVTAIQADIIRVILFGLIVVILSVIANFIAKKVILTILTSIVKKSRTNWDDVLLEKKVFNNLSHIAPAIVIYSLVDLTLFGFPGWIEVIVSGTYIYLTVIGMLVLKSFVKSIGAIYETLPSSKNKSIKGYMQVLNVFIYIVGAIMIFSIIMDKNPSKIIAGLGVLVTALMFVFKDSIMGLAAGIQLSSNDMVRPGDWIAMPGRGADGTVEDITLNTVKVRNWDKTISTIPTHSLMTESFKNWRGMEESGGRRICRSITLDVKSIKFVDDQLIEKFKKIRFIKEYIETKQAEIALWNKGQDIDDSIVVNGRRMTNIGTFRHYIEEYLKNQEHIHNEGMTFLVRQLEQTESGLPIQIYVFCKIQAWVEFEAIQSDIFDHILAVVSEFELSLFQHPTGNDFQKLLK